MTTLRVTHRKPSNTKDPQPCGKLTDAGRAYPRPAQALRRYSLNFPGCQTYLTKDPANPL